METPWRDACAIPPPTPCLQEPPKLLWDCSQKSELWSGSRKPAGESCRDPVGLADISFQLVKFPKYADIFRVISITSISACPGTSAMHHLWGPFSGFAGQGQTCPTEATLGRRFSPMAPGVLGQPSPLAGQEVTGCDYSSVGHCCAENPRALLWLKPIHGESMPQACRRASWVTRAVQIPPLHHQRAWLAALPEGTCQESTLTLSFLT